MTDSETQSLDFTKWFDVERGQLPKRPGVYEAAAIKGHNTLQQGFYYWDGSNWGRNGSTPAEAEALKSERPWFTVRHWRGLRSRITLEQEIAACDVAASVLEKKRTQGEGVAALVAIGVNRASALDYIRDYKYLVEGKVFHRAMSARAMGRFVQSIWDRHGLVGLRNAVKSLDAHIEYWENHYETRAIAMRDVADRFRREISEPSGRSLPELSEEFEGQVIRALSDSSELRAARLAASSKKAVRVAVAATAFLRNPDVVATVLLRARGKCEECQSPAPFQRRSDGSPYLEVHHRVPLALDGDDSVENAIAVCPNCHRRLHFGI